MVNIRKYKTMLYYRMIQPRKNRKDVECRYISEATVIVWTNIIRAWLEVVQYE